MRDSEALLLGAALLRPLRGVFMDGSGTAGCALGMIRRAGGRLEWMNDIHAELPCACRDLPGDAPIMSNGGITVPKGNFDETVEMAIIHVFNQHVCDGTWTIEQLADWLRTVEPKPEPSASGERAFPLVVQAA